MHQLSLPVSAARQDREGHGVVWWAALLLVLSVLVWPPADARSLRCDGSLVSAGDRRIDVNTACGEPDLMVPVRHEVIVGYGVLPYEEIWYYNFGPQRFIRELRIRNGRIVAIESRGYGFRPDAPGRCSPEALKRGMTHLELVARCGDPDDREQRVRRRYHDPQYPARGSTVTLEEEWIYNFGPRYFYRVLTLVDGRVQRVESGGRGY